MRTLTVSVKRPAAVVYDYISDPKKLPSWSLFIRSVEPEGRGWRVITQAGAAYMEFVQRNEFGVVDHWVQITPQIKVYVPLRVFANGDGSTVSFTVFRLEHMDDAAYEADIDLVRTDLDHLKQVMESRKPS